MTVTPEKTAAENAAASPTAAGQGPGSPSEVSAAVDELESSVRSLCAQQGFTHSDLRRLLSDPAVFFVASAALRYGALAHNSSTHQSLVLAVAELSDMTASN